MKHFPQPFPVMGPGLPAENFKRLNLSAEHTGPVSHPYFDLKKWVDETSKNGEYCCYGGYLEKRAIYTADQYTKKGPAVRNLHLGVDVWLPAETPVYAPYDAVVHSFANNPQSLDYGGTIILEHRGPSGSFYTLYGHIALSSLEKMYKGKQIQKGAIFCQLGDKDENGGWYPHLHLQLIMDMGDFVGDYPGVVSENDRASINNCPDPTFLVIPR